LLGYENIRIVIAVILGPDEAPWTNHHIILDGNAAPAVELAADRDLDIAPHPYFIGVIDYDIPENPRPYIGTKSV